MVRDWRLLILVPVTAAALGFAYATSTRATAAGEPPDAKDSAENKPADAGVQVAKLATKKKKRDPAEAQQAVDNAVKLIESGKSEQAIQMLGGVISGGNLPPAIMAKALLYRGVAYRQQKKPAQAIADFTSALWLKGGLSDSDRADGLRQRTAAYQEAGLSEGGEIQPAAVQREARAKERPPSTASGAWGASTTASAATPAPSSSLAQDQSASAPASGGGWDLFGGLFSGGGNLFGGGNAASSPPSTAAILNGERPAAERPSSAQRPQTSGWSGHTEVHAPRAATPVETGAIAAKSEGHLRIQIATVRTHDEAKALAAQVKREHAGALGSREPEIDKAVVGNMGSFYRVRLGPFASTHETQSVCAKLKGTGLDCLVTAQ